MDVNLFPVDPSMKSVTFTIAGIIVAICCWAGGLAFAITQGWTKNDIAPDGDLDGFSQAVVETLDASSAGNYAFTLLHDGTIGSEQFASAGRPVDGNTLFQMASISKWVTSWGIMKLVENGQIDLDAPVGDYLSRWALPATDYDNREVTTRRLLSHTAGFADGLGYGGFETLEEVQTLEASLTEAADAFDPESSGAGINLPADGTMRYSGASYTLLQLLIEEVSGRDFNEYMREEILVPLGMSRSTFVIDRRNETNLAEFYDTDGSIATHYYYTALAAASLYTSSNDMVRFLTAHCEGPDGESPGRGILSGETLSAMRIPHARNYGVKIWGLGPILYGNNDSGGYVIGHDGGNRPAINTTARIDPYSCDGIVLLTSGTEGLASKMGSDWVYWHTGRVGAVEFLGETQPLLNTFFVGSGVILLVGSFIRWRYRRNKT